MLATNFTQLAALRLRVRSRPELAKHSLRQAKRAQSLRFVTSTALKIYRPLRFCDRLVGYGEHHGVRLLKAETVREMSRNQLPTNAFPINVNGQRRDGVGFGLGFSVVVEKIPGFEFVPQGEYGWGGAASTHFWISPKDELAVVVLSQIKPFTFQCESVVKPIIYSAIR